MSFKITWDTCGLFASKIIIEKEPIGETYAEPIYPDLVTMIPITIEGLDLDGTEEGEMEGESYSFTLSDLIKQGIDVVKILHDIEDYEKRQKTFDYIDHEEEEKDPSTGKPANNNDPFPVDEKIEELETHAPFLKIHKIEMCRPSENEILLAKELMTLSDKTEKRLVKIENNLATIFRNLFRVASRAHINCVYYGGQDINRKYSCIRCIHDDRIADGGTMTLDQCLNCTRYEPIIGQVYDILDETGTSLASVLDDNQMAYMTMDERIKLNRREKQQEPSERAFINLENLDERKEGEEDFSDKWAEGFNMDWSLTPVESQVPSVAYEDGRTSSTLASSYLSAFSGGSAPGSVGGGGFINSLEASEATSQEINRLEESMQGNTNSKLQGYIDNGKQYAANNVPAALKRMNDEGFEDILREICKKEGVDPLLMLAIIVVESGGRISHPSDATTPYRGLMQVDKNRLSSNWMTKPPMEKARENIQAGVTMYKEKLRVCFNTSNPVLGMTGYNAGEGMVLGISSRSIPAIDKGPKSGGIDRANSSSWTWEQIAPQLEENVKNFYGQKAVIEKLTYYPRVHHSYLELKKRIGVNPNTSSDGTLQFPFRPQDMSKVRFTSDFGSRTHPITNVVTGHSGVDLAAPSGTDIICPADGTVLRTGFREGTNAAGQKTGEGEFIVLKHANNFHTVYMHLLRRSTTVSNGQQVKAGQILGKVGSTGGSTGPHLHFETREKGDSRNFAVDPKKHYPLLNGKVGKSLS